MKKNNRPKLLIILVAIFMLMTFIPIGGRAYASDSIGMKVSYGIEGTFKGSIAIPINVEVESDGRDVDGQVEVRVPGDNDNTYDAFVKEIKLASKEKRTLTIPVDLPENSQKISVVLTEGKNILKEETIILSQGRVSENDMLMGVLADDLNGITVRYLDFSDLNKNKEDGIGKIVSNPLNLNFIAENPKSISQLDAVVINNYSISNLKKEQYENLSTWINNGGILLIGSGENAAKTVSNIDKGFLDVTYKGTKDIGGYTVANLDIKDSSVKLQQGENPLIYSVNKGKGKIYIATFDLANTNIASREETISTWKQSLREDFINKDKSYRRYGGDIPYELTNINHRIPSKDEFKIMTLIIIFIVYVLIVGVILYFVMKKLNKREWLWGMIPIVAVVFSILLYFFGSSTRIQDLVLNQTNIIVTDKNGTSETTGYFGIGSKYKGDLSVEEPSGAVLQELVERHRYHGDNQIDINKLTKLGTKTLYRENNSYYEFKDLSALKIKDFQISGHKEIAPKIEGKLNYNSDKLVGTIKNTLGYDIKKLLVVSNKSVWDLGEIKANEEKQAEVKSYFASGLGEYGESLSESYYRDKQSGKDSKPEYKDLVRITSLMRGIDDGRMTDKANYLIAITDMPVDYGFNFGKKTVSKYDTTAIIQDMDINYTDSEGNLSYPLGYIKGQISKIDPNIHEYSDLNQVSGSGEVILDYSLDKGLELLDLRVGYINNQNRKAEALKGSVYIYNYEKNDYDKVDYKEKGESLSSPNQYIKDGKITIKLNGQDEKHVGIPEIAIKGRAK